MTAMTTAPSEELRRRVWEERIAAQARAIYFAGLATRYRRLERGLGFATALASSVTLVAALGQLGVDPLWPAVVASLSGIAVAFLKFGEAFVAMKNSSLAWDDLHRRLDGLWIEIESGEVDHQEVREALIRIRAALAPLDPASGQRALRDVFQQAAMA